MNVRVRTLVASIALVSLAGCQGGLRSALFGRGAVCAPAYAAPSYDMPQAYGPGCGCGAPVGAGMLSPYGYNPDPADVSGGWTSSTPESIVPGTMQYFDGGRSGSLPTPTPATGG